MKKATQLKTVVTLADLAQQWIDAKAAEKAANESRLMIEAEILARTAAKPEGVVGTDAGGFHVSVDYKLTRSVDTEKLQEIWPSLVDKAQACFAWKASVKVGELRKVQEFLPEEYARLASVIEVKPAKATVRVEAIEVSA